MFRYCKQTATGHDTVGVPWTSVSEPSIQKRILYRCLIFYCLFLPELFYWVYVEMWWFSWMNPLKYLWRKYRAKRMFPEREQLLLKWKNHQVFSYLSVQLCLHSPPYIARCQLHVLYSNQVTNLSGSPIEDKSKGTWTMKRDYHFTDLNSEQPQLLFLTKQMKCLFTYCFNTD